MSLRLFFQDQPTTLQTGDKIKNSEGNRYCFYRKSEELIIKTDLPGFQNSITIFACVDEFFNGIEAGSGCKIMPTGHDDEWELVANKQDP